MPLHDFRCRGCGQLFEALVRTGTTPMCPSCGSADLEQLLSSFAVSSDSLRKSHLTTARQKAEKARETKLHADHDYMHKHMTDHQ
jgi:putative FmdB family regulatory protein